MPARQKTRDQHTRQRGAPTVHDVPIGIGATGTRTASEIAHLAIDRNLTLKQAALQRGVSEDLYDRVVVPVNMTRPGTADLATTSKRR